MLKQMVVFGTLLFGSFTSTVQAQTSEATNCTIDIRSAVAALSDAQAFADDGANADAQTALDEAASAIAELQTACEDAVPIVLDSVYESENGEISLSIPEGWTIVERVQTSTTLPQETYTVFTLSPDAETAALFSDNETNVNQLEYLVASVIVASPFSVITDIGVFDPDNPLDQEADVSETAAYLYEQVRNLVGVNFVTPLETDTNTNIFSFEGVGEIRVNGTFYLRDGNQAAVLVGVFTPESGEDGSALAQAIGDSIED